MAEIRASGDVEPVASLRSTTGYEPSALRDDCIAARWTTYEDLLSYRCGILPFAKPMESLPSAAAAQEQRECADG
jgi:hypothetical protein